MPRIKGRRLCPHCSLLHPLITCPDFKIQNVKRRKEIIFKLNRCPACFGSHPFSVCRSKKTCFVCNDGSHNTLLHEDNLRTSSSLELSSSVSPAPKLLLKMSPPENSDVPLTTPAASLFSPEDQPRELQDSPF
ncbi:unnamed protein product [Bemisia tabaci]|uniref:Uncharacterized protein n=1 Tax=Bemisia tabaci TaxID=7038 RepID=A0A9P0AHJ3_BEMTA|nr:unnamed protein product [Bemisia tabaci]